MRPRFGHKAGNYHISHEQPQVMHIDLNSCFATVEQQANPFLRGKPLAVTNRISKNCCVIACSYEAKALGVKVGMGFSEAKARAPQLVMLETDPPKYHLAYRKLAAIMKSYSPHVTMKSIDEGVIDFHGTLGTVHTRSLQDIGMEIKQRLRDDMGDWMRCNVGIAPNRFLAKLAANLHKPNGLDTIDHTNLLDVYKSLELTDLPGINVGFKARLNAYDIFTPLQFLQADAELLHHGVFKSVIGNDWYQRLRGYEVDNVETKLGMVGRQFVMDLHDASEEQVLNRLHYLCQTTGMKLRYNNCSARGLLLWMRFRTGEGWYKRKLFKSTFYTDQEIYRRMLLLFNERPIHMKVHTIGITCYHLEASTRSQLSFDEAVNRAEWLTEAIDEINERYGNFAVTFANAKGGSETVKQKVPFGSTKYFDLLFKET